MPVDDSSSTIEVVGCNNQTKIRPPHIKLHYFDIVGRAEVLRLILTIGGIKYEDVKVRLF